MPNFMVFIFYAYPSRASVGDLNGRQLHRQSFKRTRYKVPSAHLLLQARYQVCSLVLESSRPPNIFPTMILQTRLLWRKNYLSGSKYPEKEFNHHWLREAPVLTSPLVSIFYYIEWYEHLWSDSFPSDAIRCQPTGSLEQSWTALFHGCQRLVASLKSLEQSRCL